MEHTKGNWEIDGDELTLQIVCKRRGYVLYNRIAILNDFVYSGKKLPKKEQEANAKLIAAAPELLQRSKDLLDSILAVHQYNKDALIERDIDRIERMQKTIKKATS